MLHPPLLLLSACLSHPLPSSPPYRAVGQQADWTLIIDDRFVTFIGGPGQQPLLQPAPKPIIGFAGEIYQTPRINVNIVHAQLQRRTHQPRLSGPGPGGRRWTPLQRMRRAVVVFCRDLRRLFLLVRVEAKFLVGVARQGLDGRQNLDVTPARLDVQLPELARRNQ